MAEKTGIDLHIVFFADNNELNREFFSTLQSKELKGEIRTYSPTAVESLVANRPAALLIDARSDASCAPETIASVKTHLNNLPIILLLDEPEQEMPEIGPVSNIDGIVYRKMPPGHIAAVMRGFIRQSFTIHELLQSNRNLNEISTTDALTGVYNRGYMIDRLNLEFKRASRNHEPLSCLMIDLDHFKQINDTYGHSFGDIVLRAVSTRIKDLIRETDIFGRYGGEEFLILLPNTSLDGAAYLAEKLRHGLESERISHDYFSLLVTASFGAASTELPDVITSDHLLQLSDRALYRAKESGRNRVCVEHLKEHEENEEEASHDEPEQQDTSLIDLVTNDPDNSEICRKLQQCKRFHLNIHHGSEAFLDAFRKHDPRLVLVDVLNTECNHLDFCRKIKEHVRDFFIPIVLVNSDEQIPDPRDLADAGVTEIFKNDIAREDMELRLLTLLNIKDLHDRWRHTYRDLTMARTRLIKVERLTALGEMATGVAHDFNNILSTVLGRTQLLRQKTKGKSILNDLAIIEQAANDGASTIRRIQGFSRVTTDHSYEEIDLVQVVHDCVQMTRTRWKDEAEMRGILYRVRRVFPDKLKVIGSMAEMREVITNLIMNALDAMPSGGELTFEGKYTGEDAVLSVRDTGEGMEESVVKRIFDPFFSTKKGEGTGLGLSVAYGIIARHNARIECSSTPGQGTEFRIIMPASEVKDTQEGESAEVDEMETSVVETVREEKEFTEKRALKVMIIDDEKPIRDIMHELLSEEGHQAFEAATGEKALEIIRKEPMDLVFTDLSMPGMNGWEVAEKIHALYPATPIILTSGWGSDYNFDKLTQSGISHVLPKPVPIGAFMQIIQRTMRGEPIQLQDDF